MGQAYFVEVGRLDGLLALPGVGHRLRTVAVHHRKRLFNGTRLNCFIGVVEYQHFGEVIEPFVPIFEVIILLHVAKELLDGLPERPRLRYYVLLVFFRHFDGSVKGLEKLVIGESKDRFPLNLIDDNKGCAEFLGESLARGLLLLCQLGPLQLFLREDTAYHGYTEYPDVEPNRHFKPLFRLLRDSLNSYRIANYYQGASQHKNARRKPGVVEAVEEEEAR